MISIANLLNLTRPLGEYDSRELASIGLHTMTDTDSFESGREIGKHFLGAIAENDRHRVERKVASVARNAAEGVFPASAFQIEKFALAVIAGGITGPTASTLAGVGIESVPRCVTPQEGRAVAYKFLKGIQETSEDPTAIRLAQVACSIADRNDISATSAKRVEMTALEILSGNPDLGSSDMALSAFGLAAAHTGSPHDDRIIGDLVVRSIVDNSERPAVRVLGETALRAAERLSSHFDAVEVQQGALAGILAKSAE